MCHDGTYDAYDVKKDGDQVELIYDMSKDKRFNLLVEYNGNINKVPKNLIEQFNNQLSLYQVMRDDLKMESEYSIGDINIKRDNIGTD
jgi:hypothetical protein